MSIRERPPVLHEIQVPTNLDPESVELFDDEDDNSSLQVQDTESAMDSSDATCVPPERRALPLPSNHPHSNHPDRQVELKLRIQQASRYLSVLRESIADKSFQYSHIIRSAPSKGVRTRSRAIIGRMSENISHYARVYCQSRAAMSRLGADERTMNTFKVLTKDDVKASTAILNPNIPGSSSLKLSWIWNTRTRSTGNTPDSMQECQ